MADGGGYGHGAAQHEGAPQRRIRNMRRPAEDYNGSLHQWISHRNAEGYTRSSTEFERPSPSYAHVVMPPSARGSKAVDAVPARHLHTSFNKVRHPINVVKWTPSGRRLMTGSTSGEFTLWNGFSWNFETLMQAHDSAVRAAVWSHNEDWLLSSEHTGIVKYWQPNFNNVKSIQAHDEPVRAIAFARTDLKFVTASDDTTLKIFDFAAGRAETVLTGHQWDVKSVDFHPRKGLVVSGSKDHQIKLWDPRNGRCLTTLHGHKNSVSKVLFEPNEGFMLASCARDNTARILDIRMMRDVYVLRGHEKDITTLCWHPFYRSLLSTGGADGAVFHYLLDEQNLPEGVAPTISPYDVPEGIEQPAQTLYPAFKIPFAHEFPVWSMDWHPLGHVLATGSNDRSTRFWTRPKPGDASYLTDRYQTGQGIGDGQGNFKGTKAERGNRADDDYEEDDEADALVDQSMPGGQSLPGLPGLAGLPGLPGIGSTPAAPFPPTGNVPPLPPFGMPGAGMVPPPPPNGLPLPLPPNMDIEKLKQMFGGSLPPMPPPGGISFPPGGAPGGLPFPPPGMVPPPPGFNPMAMSPGFPPGLPGTTAPGADVGGSIRSRGPLLSQQESLKREMQAGNYTTRR